MNVNKLDPNNQQLYLNTVSQKQIDQNLESIKEKINSLIGKEFSETKIDLKQIASQIEKSPPGFGEKIIKHIIKKENAIRESLGSTVNYFLSEDKLNFTDDFKYDLLKKALGSTDHNLALHILSTGFEIDFKKNGETLLHFFCKTYAKSSNKSFARIAILFLIKQGARIDLPSADGHSPHDYIKEVIEKNPNVKIALKHIYQKLKPDPLASLELKKSFQEIDELVEKLSPATKEKKEEIFEEIAEIITGKSITKDALIDLLEMDDETNIEVVKHLLEKKLIYLPGRSDQFDLLLTVLQEQSFDSAQLLIDNGIQLNLVKNCETLLTHFCYKLLEKDIIYRRYLEVINFLIDRKADLTIKGKDNLLPVQMLKRKLEQTDEEQNSREYLQETYNKLETKTPEQKNT